MSSFDFTTLLEKLWPEGAFNGIDPNGDFYKLLSGMSEDYQDIYDKLDLLAHIRDPRLTDLLADLEREYGIIPDTSLTDAVRRTNLAATMFAKPTTASWEHLENALHDAGFTTLSVTPNNPMVDPATPGGTLLVNGDIYTEQSPAYYAAAGSSIAYAGGNRAYSGYYLSMNRIAKSYTIPTGPPYWPWAFVFWVGGAASGWPGTPAVALANVDSQRRTQLENLILKLKPAFTWCLLRITWT
jgi:hypothetical protein